MNLSEFTTPSRIILVLQILVATLFGLSRLQLNKPWEILSLYEILLIAIFFISLICVPLLIEERNYTVQDLGYISLLSAVLLFGLFAGLPTSKTYKEAEYFTNAKDATIEYAYKVATPKDPETKKSITFQEASNKVTKRVKPENQELAIDALETIVQNPTMLLEDVKQELNPTVPIKLQEWNCLDIGCSFGSIERVWTISRSDIYLSAAFSVFCLLAISWISYTPKGKSEDE